MQVGCEQVYAGPFTGSLMRPSPPDYFLITERRHQQMRNTVGAVRCAGECGCGLMSKEEALLAGQVRRIAEATPESAKVVQFSLSDSAI